MEHNTIVSRGTLIPLNDVIKQNALIGFYQNKQHQYDQINTVKAF